MEAVKMSGSTAQVKSQIRTASADMPKGGDEFMKLLQVKKDTVQPDQGNTKQTEDKETPKETEDVSESKKEASENTEDEKVSLTDTQGQDILLQAAMQQTAAQMAGIVTDAGGKAPEPVTAEETAEDAVLSVDTGEETVQTAGQLTEAAEQPVQGKEADPSDGQETKQGDGRLKDLGGEKVQEKAPEVQPKVQAETGPRETVQTEEKTENQESLYSAVSSTAESRQEFAAQKPEQVPLKTSESQLPQDLGKTLADRLPGTGRELIVELEPANLGKLTIRMTYEAGRAAVSIMASNPKTLEILNEKAAEIASILEEKTGEETIIYTQAPEQEREEENPNPNQNGQGYEGRQEKQEARQERHDTESFAQQLRLGLV